MDRKREDRGHIQSQKSQLLTRSRTERQTQNRQLRDRTRTRTETINQSRNKPKRRFIRKPDYKIQTKEKKKKKKKRVNRTYGSPTIEAMEVFCGGRAYI